MSKVERRKFFEELCRMRALYRLRSEHDSQSVLSVPEALAYGTALLEGEVSAPMSQPTVASNGSIGRRGPDA